MAAPKTVKTYPLTGTKDFEIPFEYLARKFVAVTLIGTDRKELVLNVDYRFTQRTIITTTQTWGPGSGYTLMEIKRVTSATERLVDFSDGSILRASDLNTATVQALHIAEEGRDIATDTIGVDNDGNLDARGRRIVNLADAINPGDAVTLKQNQEWAGSALNQADRATAQANASEASAVRSANSASQANASAVASYQDAERSITARQQSENAQINSQNARDTSIASAAESKAWANTPENTLVQPGLYSSLHYSRKSATSALQSFTDANRSKTEADRSTTEADRAKREADKLGNANGFMDTIEVASVGDGGVRWKPNMSLVIQGTANVLKSIGGVYKRYIHEGDVAANRIMSGGVAQTAPSTTPTEIAWNGNFDALNTNVGTYSGALTIREKNLGGAQSNDARVAPSLTFHWGAVQVRQLWMGSDGIFRLGSQYNQAGADSIVTRNASGQLPLGAAGTYIQSDGDIIAPSQYVGGTLITELMKYRGRHYFKREVLADGRFGTQNVPIPLARAIQDGEMLTFTHWAYDFNTPPVVVWRGQSHVINFGNGGTTQFTLAADGTSITVQQFIQNQGILKVYAMWMQFS